MDELSRFLSSKQSAIAAKSSVAARSSGTISELRGPYDCALVYMCGCGDGSSFIAQDNERISVAEIHAALDAAGMARRPRIIVLDLFETQVHTHYFRP